MHTPHIGENQENPGGESELPGNFGEGVLFVWLKRVDMMDEDEERQISYVPLSFLPILYLILNLVLLSFLDLQILSRNSSTGLSKTHAANRESPMEVRTPTYSTTRIVPCPPTYSDLQLCRTLFNTNLLDMHPLRIPRPCWVLCVCAFCIFLILPRLSSKRRLDIR